MRRCAWCGMDLSGVKEAAGLVSHGLCLPCADLLFSRETLPLQNVIDQLEIPVLVVDSDVTVELVNKQAQALLGALPEQPAHRRGGNVFACVYAHLPGGCC